MKYKSLKNNQHSLQVLATLRFPYFGFVNDWSLLLLSRLCRRGRGRGSIISHPNEQDWWSLVHQQYSKCCSGEKLVLDDRNFLKIIAGVSSDDNIDWCHNANGQLGKSRSENLHSSPATSRQEKHMTRFFNRPP